MSRKFITKIVMIGANMSVWVMSTSFASSHCTKG